MQLALLVQVPQPEQSSRQKLAELKGREGTPCKDGSADHEEAANQQCQTAGAIKYSDLVRRFVEIHAAHHPRIVK